MSGISADARNYTDEPVRFRSLQVVDINREARAVHETYRNQVLLQVNQHCLRLGVLRGQYPWHVHPKSDELFLVLEGSLAIELADGTALTLGPNQAVTVPAGVVHRTRGDGRTVNVCMEALAAETVLVPDPRTYGP
jgi:mannose-6-phosphate isomerase-like protein (cupin superfamily)